MHSHHSSFTFLKPHVFPLFSFSLVSLPCTLGSFIITPYIYQSFSAVPAKLPFLSLQLLQWIFWGPGERPEARAIRWAGFVFTCCLAWFRVLCGGVWRQSDHVCEVSAWMETEAPCFPPTHTLHILTKESHSLGQVVPDTWEGCPSCAPFIPPCLPSLFSLFNSVFPAP